MKELKPCPFCGSKDLELLGHFSIRWVACNSCYAESGSYDTDEEAIEAWNRRVKE